MKTFAASLSAGMVTTIEFILAMKQEFQKYPRKQINS